MLNSIKELSKNDLEKILNYLIQSYTTPAFGILPKTEINLIFLESLIKMGYISNEPISYELVAKLKITNAKARKLLYERELRKYDLKDLNSKVKTVLSNPIIQKNGDLFMFEVDNPLLIDHIKNELKELGYLSDSSFSPSIIRLSREAFISLLEKNLDNKDLIKQKLSMAGIQESNIKGFLKSLLLKMGSKFADQVGEDMVKETYEYINPLFENFNDVYIKKIKELFNN